MSLKFPEDATCMVEGCTGKVTHLLSLRMRRPDTGADWAPNLPAYFCSLHAIGGADIEIAYTPTHSHENRMRVRVGMNQIERKTEIR